jgi:hypothetical protein
MTISFNRLLLRNFSFALGLGTLLVLSLGVVGRLAPHALARIAECNNNSIIYCGFTSKSALISTIKSGDGKGHKDLTAIYNEFGLPASEYSRFVDEAQPAVVNRDGTVVVAGQVVATNAVTFGRYIGTHSGAGMVTKTIGSTTIYGNAPSRTFGPYSSMTGYVLFDASGTPEFIILDTCGNTVTATLVKSSVACNLLNATPVNGKLNTYDFTSSASVGGLASLTEYAYDFGDGSGNVTKTNGSDVVEHKYSKVGTFTAMVTVYATLPWGTQISSTTPACATPVTVVQPYYQCLQLGGALLDQAKYSYRFITDMKYGNGATFVSADFDFGDGKTATGVKSTDDKTVSVDHAYAKAGNYSASAVLRFSVDGKTVTASTCRARVTPTAPPVPECKPGVPVGDIRCNPCPTDASIDQNDERCVPVTTSLPNTGAGNVVALGSVALIGGFLWYRHVLFGRHKRAYLAAEIGASPLPLGNPLVSEAPLAGTPLQPAAPKRRSLRRRQF